MSIVWVPDELRCPHTIATIRPLFCQDKCGPDEWVKIYHAAKRAYYNGDPILYDMTYDRLETEARKRWPNDQRFWSVGLSS